MYFDFWRDPGTPTQFYQVSIPTTFDPVLLSFTYVIIVISLAFILIVPGFRGRSRCWFIIRVSISLFLLWVILMGIHGQNWEQAHLNTTAPYTVFSRYLIKGEIGVKIGLTSVNITLRTNPLAQQFQHGVEELIDFNERFEWDYRQGREGYGPFAGKLQQQYRAAQHAGTPLPILWAAEAFTMDEEQIRWGRSYRTAGWFTWCALLTSFPTWAIANLLSLVVAFYAGLLFFVTGILMLIGTIIWATLRWGTQPLVIVFQDGDLRLQLGGTFYLVLAGGILACVYGAILIVMDLWRPEAASEFLMTGQSNNRENYYHNDDETEALNSHTEKSDIRVSFPSFHQHGEAGDAEQEYNGSVGANRRPIIYRSRTTHRRRFPPVYRRKREGIHTEPNDNVVSEMSQSDDDRESRLRSNRHGSGESSEPPPSYRENSFSDMSSIQEDHEIPYQRTRV